MVPNTVLEQEMYDVSLPNWYRVLSCIRRFSWGHLSDFAVDAMPQLDATDPRPRLHTQDAIASRLNVPTSSVSAACIWLKEKKYLLPRGPELYPDDKQQPSLFASHITLGSTASAIKSPGVETDSMDLPTPFGTFKARYLAENRAINEKCEMLKAEREWYKEKVRSCTAELSVLDRKILGAWRDCQRSKRADIIFNSTGADPVSKADQFITPGGTAQESWTENHVLCFDSPPKSNGISGGGNGPLKVLNPKQVTLSVSQSVTVDRLTEIAAAIPPDLIESRGEPLTNTLLKYIAEKLRGAPVDPFRARILQRQHAITSLGMLINLADDVGRVWEQAEKKREERNAAEAERMSIVQRRNQYEDWCEEQVERRMETEYPPERLEPAVTAELKLLKREQPEWFARVPENTRREMALGQLRNRIRQELPAFDAWQQLERAKEAGA
jgi:hypothetical protein